MNKEFPKNEEVVTLEANENPVVLAIETEKSDQEFATEILSKIENEINSEPSSQAEIQKIDNSAKLNNPSINEEIKKELDLENKLGDLDNEMKVSCKETKSKISEISGSGKENPLELSEFSKRYSTFYRKQIAQKINNLRFKYQTKLQQKPAEIESSKLSILDFQSLVEETKNKKTSDEESLKNLQEQRKILDLEIEELKNNLNKRKNSFVYKIREKFIFNKLSQEAFELLQSEGITKEGIKEKLYQKDFEIFQTIKEKKEDFDKLDTSLQNKEQEIKDKNTLLKELKTSIENKYKSINEAEEIMNSDFEIKEIEKTITDFYSEMSTQKKNIEAGKKERSIAEISKEKDVLFLHSIPLEIVIGNSFSQNNRLVETNKFGPEEKIKMILGVEPTISVSTINKENQTLVGNFGLIFKEGVVLSAYAGDAGTLLDEGVYNRKSKYDHSLQTSTIQQDIGTNLVHAVGHLQKRDPKSNSSVESMDQGWNELVIENPQAAGLFYQKDNTHQMPGDLAKAKYISKQLNLPLYILDKEKIYQINEETEDLKEVNKEYVFSSSKSLSTVERKNLVEEMIDKEAFNKKLETIYQFNGYNVGKTYFKFMKRFDSGEKVSVVRVGKKEDLEDKNEILEFFDTSFEIKTTEFAKEQWELFGKKEDWEKYGAYYSTYDSETVFRTQFSGLAVWEPHAEFIVESDNISSYINMAEKELERLSEQGKELKKEDGDVGQIPIRKKSVLFILFGFMEECKKAGDIKNYEKAKNVIEKFGNINECETFVNKRVGQDGKFQYLNEDVPIEIRKKIKELDNV